MAGNPLANMMMNNNPIMQMANMLKNGGNPSAMFNQLMQKNPAMGQMVQAMNGKSPEQLGEMMRNAAQQRGIDLGQMAQQIGMPPEVAAKYGISMQKDQTNNA